MSMRIALVRGYGAFGKHRKAKRKSRRSVPASFRANATKLPRAAKACSKGKWKKHSKSFRACVSKHMKSK